MSSVLESSGFDSITWINTSQSEIHLPTLLKRKPHKRKWSESSIAFAKLFNAMDINMSQGVKPFISSINLYNSLIGIHPFKKLRKCSDETLKKGMHLFEVDEPLHAGEKMNFNSKYAPLSKIHKCHSLIIIKPDQSWDSLASEELCYENATPLFELCNYNREGENQHAIPVQDSKSTIELRRSRPFTSMMQRNNLDEIWPIAEENALIGISSSYANEFLFEEQFDRVLKMNVDS